MAGSNIYSSQSISGYNTSPPPDDGSQVASNVAKWSDIKDKFGDPVKTLAEAINTQMVTAGAKAVNNGDNEDNVLTGCLAFTSSELTISSGSVTPARRHHSVDTESDAATDDLDTLATSSLTVGAEVILRAEHTDRTVVVKHNTGNMLLDGDADFSLDDDEKRICFQLVGTTWYELWRSENGLPAATQAQMETATSTTETTTPGRQHFHPGHPKAWGTFDPAAALDDDYGISSITDNATGDFTVNLTTAFSGATYTAIAVDVDEAGSDADAVVASRVAASFDVEMVNDAGTLTETSIDFAAVVAFGDHA